MRKACIHPGCPHTSVNGNPRCPQHQTEHDRPRNQRANQRRGTTPAARRLRAKVNQAGGAICRICWEWHPANRIHIDHAVPLEHGGPDADHNLRPLCITCHKRITT